MPFQLNRSDLISFEAILKNSLAEVFDFTSYSLYFPREIPRQMKSQGQITPVIEKDRVLLPLTIKDKFLGVFLARGINQDKVTVLKNHLQMITSLILDKIVLHKKCMVDSRTGLYNQDHFQQAIEKEIKAVLSSISPDGPGAIMDNGQEHHSASFGVMLLNLDNFKWINNTFGYAFGDRILSGLASRIKASLPEQVIMSRLEGDTFALPHPHVSPGKSLDFLDSLRRIVEDTVFEYDVSGEKISLTASGGASFFPHDIKGPQFRNNPDEIARIIQNKAEQAMYMAKKNGGNRVYSFSRLLSQGGVIMEALPLGRLVINLGKNVDASEGQKFMVWSSKFNGSSKVQGSTDQPSLGHYPPIHKGEIAILEVQDRISIAEVLYLNDPSWRMEQGDRLSLLNDKDSILENEGLAQNTSPKKDILTRLYSYRDFLSLWNQKRSRPDSFCMTMIKIQNYPSASEQSIESEKLIQHVVKFLQAEMGSHILGGRYSSTCLVFYLPDAVPDKLVQGLEKLQDSLKQKNEILLNAGIGYYP
ncbi:MAG: GGDEF domain-containing protein [Desulfonatronovibrionaceae bacterium]